MALADIATLGLRVDAREVRQADDALDQFGRTGANTETRINGVNQAAERMRRAFASVVAALGVQEIIKQADAWANLQGRLSLVADGQERLARTNQQLFALAQRTRQGLLETSDLYGKISRSTQDLNKTDSQRLRLTETINKALAISGTGSAEAAGAITQLGQAFGSGALRGDEFNSVLEGMPRLAEAIAAGMGKSTGELRALAAEGKLTSEVLFSSLSKQAGVIDAEFAKLPITVGGAITQVENAVLRTIGVFDQGNQLSVGLARSISTVAENMGLLAGAAATLAAVKVVTMLESWIAGLVASARAAAVQRAATVATAQAEAAAAAVAVELTAARLAEVRAATLAATGNVQLALTTNALIPLQNAHAAATARLDAAMLGLSVAQRAAALGSRALNAALALTGGPIGLIVTILGVAATAWSVYQSKQEEANAKAAADTAQSTAQIVGDLDKQIAKFEARAKLAKEAGAKDLAQQDGPAADRAAEILTRINELKAQGAKLSAADSVELITQQGIYDELVAKANRLKVVKGSVTAASDAEKLSDWMAKNTQYLDKAGKITAAIAAAKKELGTAFNSDVEKKIRDSFASQDVAKAKGAYQELTASIREKIAEAQLELAVGRNATESQKIAIKMDQETLAGKLKLSAASRDKIATDLAELAALEKKQKAAQFGKDQAQAQDEANLAYQESAATLEAMVAGFGGLSDARELDVIGIKNQAAAQRQLLQWHYNEVDVTDDMRAKLAADTEERTRNERAIAGQTKALAYAEQLRQENAQFAVDAIVDPKAKAAAQLTIDKALWSSRLALAAEGTDARKLLEEQYTQWLQNQAIKPQLEQQMRMWASIEDAAREAFVGMLSSGKDTFTRLRDSLKNTLYAFLYEMTVKKWIISVQADVAGSIASSAAAGGGSQIGNLISAGKSIYSSLSGAGASILGGLSSGIGQIGTALGSNVMQSFAHGLAGFKATPESMQALGINPTAVSAGNMAGTAAGYAGGAAVGVMGGRALSGGYALSGSGNGLVNAGTALGAVVGGPIGAAIGGLIAGAGNRLFGRKAPEIQAQGLRGTYTAGRGVTGEDYQKIKEKGGLFRSDKDYTNTQTFDAAKQSQISQAFGAITDSSSNMAKALGLGADALTGYSKTFDVTLTNDATKNQEALEKFFGGVADEVALKLVPNLAQFSQTGESASDTLARLASEFEATSAAMRNLGKTADAVFGSDGMASAAARDRLVQLAGGADTLLSLTSSFANTFLSQADRLAPVAQMLNAELSKLGLATIPKTNDEFAALVRSIDPTTEAGGTLLVKLLQLGDAFAMVSKGASDAAQEAKDAAQDAKDAFKDRLDAAYSMLERSVDAEKQIREQAHAAEMKRIDKQRDAVNKSIKDLQSLSDALHGAMSKNADLVDERAARSNAQAQIASAAAIARAGGPLPKADSLKGALSTLSNGTEKLYGSFEDYQRDAYTTAINLADLADLADGQLTEAQQQLAALDALKEATTVAYDAQVERLDGILETAQRQIDAVNGVNVSTMSVAAAVAALQGLLGNNSTAGIVGAYGSALGRAPDAAGLAYYEKALAAGGTIADVTKAIQTSTEGQAKIAALYQEVLGRQADAAGLAYYANSGSSLADIKSQLIASDEYQNSWRTSSANGGGASVSYNGSQAVTNKADAVDGTDAIVTAIKDLGTTMFNPLYQITKNTGRAATAADTTLRRQEANA